jgi:hypothetical protein
VLMINDHLTDLELELYRNRGMAPARLLVANAHLFTCEECYRRYGVEDREEAALAILRDLGELNGSEFEHLSFEQLADYVDNRVEEKNRAEINQHVHECEECETRLQELIDLKPLVMVEATQKQEKRHGRWKRAMPLWKTPSLALGLQIASLVLIVVVLLWAISLKKRISGLENEISQLEKAHEVVAQNADDANGASALQGDGSESAQGATTPGSEETPAVLVALRDGSAQITLDNKGNISGLPGLSPSDESSIKEALTTARLQVPALPSGTDKTDVFMGQPAEESFALRGPVGKVVQTARPTFRWQALKDATSYAVLLKDSTGRVIESGSLTALAWAPEAPLKRGMIYTWQVVALKNGKEVVSPAPAQSAAQVKILEQVKIDELARVSRSHPDAHLLLGILYARAGLLDEAAREFTILLRNNPRSDVAQKLLNTVKASRR